MTLEKPVSSLPKIRRNTPILIFWGTGQSERLGQPVDRSRVNTASKLVRLTYNRTPNEIYFGANRDDVQFLSRSRVSNNIDKVFDDEVIPAYHAFKLSEGIWNIEHQLQSRTSADSNHQIHFRRVMSGEDDLFIVSSPGYASGVSAGLDSGNIAQTSLIRWPCLETNGNEQLYFTEAEVDNEMEADSSSCIYLEKLD